MGHSVALVLRPQVVCSGYEKSVSRNRNAKFVCENTNSQHLFCGTMCRAMYSELNLPNTLRTDLLITDLELASTISRSDQAMPAPASC